MPKLTISRTSLALLFSLWLASFSFVQPLAQDIWNFGRAEWASGRVDTRVQGPCDFVAFWSAGQLAGNGHAEDAYLPGSILNAERANPAAHGLRLLWYYPPPALLLALPVQGLPFFPAFLFWDTGLLLLSALILRLAEVPVPVIAAAALSPAALLNADLGQIGLLTGSLLVAGLLLLDRHPLASGGLLGTLLIKPQIVILAPVIVLASRAWPATAAAVVTVMGLCAFTTWLLGYAVWPAFLAHSPASTHYILDQAFPRHPPPAPGSDEFYGTSVFWMLRSFRLDPAWSYAGQAVAALAAILACWRAWRQPDTDRIALTALTVCLGFLVTPYGYLYDYSAVCIAFAALCWRQRRVTFTDVLVFTWPLLSLIIGFHFFLELTPIILCLGACRARYVLFPPVALA